MLNKTKNAKTEGILYVNMLCWHSVHNTAEIDQSWVKPGSVELSLTSRMSLFTKRNVVIWNRSGSF